MTKTTGILVLLLAAPLATTAQTATAHDPVADPAAVVRAGHARFTVLTPRMVRLEWSADDAFEDHASLVFLDRRLPVPAFRATTSRGWLTIRTDSLTLRYRPAGGRFDAADLEVRRRLDGRDVVWHPGMPDTANLKGTARTLDGARGPIPLQDGLVSRAGWTVVDDSKRPLFDDSDPPWVLPRPDTTRIDWYFFGYGHDYAGALRDFTRVAGRIPIPPRFAFGAWWSRYWAYTDTELLDLVRQFDLYRVPLDVLVVDMDWHNTFELRWNDDRKDQAGQHLGWTGYTWNHAYFPEPDTFLAEVHRDGLHTTLNLHPAGGIQPYEHQYAAVARANGIDPASKKYVPFKLTDRRFVKSYFDLVVHPLERQGVDFWWLDWQQWHQTDVPGLNPTWWLNYLFFTDMAREGRHRPLIFHRWGGLGNHRYQIGFSGDAYSTWRALAFEPRFTATAANVGFDYWSHDIGGHLNGEVSGELYTRWIQFGIFSPILRTHTTKNANAERRIWAYPYDDFVAMRDAYRLRYRLIPYIYTAARHVYDDAVALVRPLYWDWPERDAAYRFGGEYGFGPDMVVRPVVQPLDSASLLAADTLWVPPGDWIEWSTGARLHGPAVVARAYALDELPVLVRAGAIIPMQPDMLRSDARPVDPLILAVFPGDSGATRVYEDAGDTQGYETGHFTWTPVRQRTTVTADGGAAGASAPAGSVVKAGATLRLDIAPIEGSFAGMLQRRGYEVRLPGTLPPTRVRWQGTDVTYDADCAGRGVPSAAGPSAAAPDTSAAASAPVCWSYDGQTLTTTIRLPAEDVHAAKRLVVDLPPTDASLLDGTPGLLARMHRAATLLERTWPDDWPPDAFMDFVQTGRRITLHPDSAAAELSRLQERLPAVLEKVRAMKGDSTIIAQALAHLGAQRH